jgi:hypothetical protein
MEEHYKVDFYTDDCVMYIADEGWYFTDVSETCNYGRIVYDSPKVKFSKYYKVKRILKDNERIHN